MAYELLERCGCDFGKTTLLSDLKRIQTSIRGRITLSPLRFADRNILPNGNAAELANGQTARFTLPDVQSLGVGLVCLGQPPPLSHIDFWQKVEVCLVLVDNILMQNILGDFLAFANGSTHAMQRLCS